MDDFLYLCPREGGCGGSGEVLTTAPDGDPTLAETKECLLCGGSGEVALADIETHDQWLAETSDYWPSVRTLTPADPPKPPSTPRLDDPWSL